MADAEEPGKACAASALFARASLLPAAFWAQTDGFARHSWGRLAALASSKACCVSYRHRNKVDKEARRKIYSMLLAPSAFIFI
jgi:hypothetical protein